MKRTLISAFLAVLTLTSCGPSESTVPSSSGSAESDFSSSELSADSGQSSGESSSEASGESSSSSSESSLIVSETHEVQIVYSGDTSLYVGETAQLSATVDGVVSSDVVWSSSDEEIATVSDAGLVTALKEGEVTIEARQGEFMDVLELAIEVEEYTEGLIFSLGEGYCNVDGYEGTSAEVTIPHYYQGLPVMVINNNAFRDNLTVVSISIPDTVTGFWPGAFNGCANLERVDIPENSQLQYITNGVFANCPKLTEVFIPDTIISVYSYAFDMCENLTIFTSLPKEASESWMVDWNGQENPVVWEYCGIKGHDTVLGLRYAVSESESGERYATIYKSEGNAASLTIPGQYEVAGESVPVKVLANRLFDGAENLSSVGLPSELESIENDVFFGCSGLNGISLPESLRHIGENAFNDCAGLSGSLAIPESVDFIGDFAFNGCVSLRSVWLSENIETLGHFAFANCDDCSFYCESSAKPEGWDEQWNGVAPLGETIWGASYDEFQSA